MIKYHMIKHEWNHPERVTRLQSVGKNQIETWKNQGWKVYRTYIWNDRTGYTEVR